MPKERTGRFAGETTTLGYIDVAVPFSLKRSLRQLAAIKGVSMSYLCASILYSADLYRSGELSSPEFQRFLRSLLISPEPINMNYLTPLLDH